VRVVPSWHVAETEAGRPSDSRGVIGVPSALRKSGHEPDEKPSAWKISWMAVERSCA
jgi:hypothetical protein